MIPAYLALGSNLGDRKATLNAAVAALGETPEIVVRAVSSYHETAPVGGPGGQGTFLNAAVAIETLFDPTDLLRRLHAIEAEAGRVRTVRWGERPLDLDLLLYSDAVIDQPDLTIPHPRMAVRRFVLTPLAEIAPDVVDPLTRRTIVELIENLDREPRFLCLIGMPLAVFRRVAETLNAVGLHEPIRSRESYVDTALDHPLDFFAVLDQKAREFDASRWSAEIWGDRWMMSNFWPGLMAIDVSTRLKETDLESWRDHYRESEPRIVRPTFVAASPVSYRHLRRWTDKNRAATLGGSELPLLCPGYTDPLGFIDRCLKTPQLYAPPEPARHDTIVAEILAACASIQG